MSKSRYIPVAVKCSLWGRAAGRCQMCNTPLSWHPQTKEDANLAEAAHIIGFSDNGPRGEQDLPSDRLNDISNLMLLCRLCHTPVVDAREDEYTVDRLRKMKSVHENRIEIVSSIGQDRTSHILLYGANVGDHNPILSYKKTAPALIPDNRLPASRTPITLGMSNSVLDDQTDEFWQVQSNQLNRMVSQQVRPRLRQGDVEHMSIFALAPQPLLIQLGYLLCDINYGARVYQLHRDSADWKWQNHPDELEYFIEKPKIPSGKPALVLALSATIIDERIFDTLGKDAAIWRITVPEPNNDLLKSAQQLQQFRKLIRPLLDEIKNQYPNNTTLNVFPAAPVSVCVELGRAIQPKAHMPLQLWDQNKNLGGFIPALSINTAQGGAS